MITFQKLLRFFRYVLIAGLSLVTLPAFAQTTVTALTNPLNATDLPSLISEILGYVVTIGSIFLSLMLVFVGFQYVMARGNPEAVSKAHSTLLWTVVGGLLLLGAGALAAAISATIQAL